MSMERIIGQIKEEARRQREDERKLIGEIAAASSQEIAGRAAGVLDPRKHAYSFKGYLSLLQMLLEALLAGMQPDAALDAAQNGWGMEEILSAWEASRRESPMGRRKEDGKGG